MEHRYTHLENVLTPPEQGPQNISCCYFPITRESECLSSICLSYVFPTEPFGSHMLSGDFAGVISWKWGGDIKGNTKIVCEGSVGRDKREWGRQVPVPSSLTFTGV